MKQLNESGRSMVEMLGVLAIIGVLSIGGIAGYTIAMDRYRANEIVNTASKLCVLAHTRASQSSYRDDATFSDLELGGTNVANCVREMKVRAYADDEGCYVDEMIVVSAGACDSADSGVIKAVKSISEGGDIEFSNVFD